MAKYRVMSWRGIPSQVKVTGDDGTTVSRMLPALFQQQIDRVAMAEGLAGTDEYLEAWDWSAEVERDGDAETLADLLVEELSATWKQQHGAGS